MRPEKIDSPKLNMRNKGTMSGIETTSRRAKQKSWFLGHFLH